MIKRKIINKILTMLLCLLLSIIVLLFVISKFRNIDKGIGILATSSNVEISKKNKVFIAKYISSQNMIFGEHEQYKIKEVWTEHEWFYKDRDLNIEKTEKAQLLISINKVPDSLGDINYYIDSDKPGSLINNKNLVITLDINEIKKDSITIFFITRSAL
jgi:hypothetical protein